MVLSNEDVIVSIGNEIIDSSNYEIDINSYNNNVNKGKANVTIKGVNNLFSSKKVSFTIASKFFVWLNNLWIPGPGTPEIIDPIEIGDDEL